MSISHSSINNYKSQNLDFEMKKNDILLNYYSPRILHHVNEMEVKILERLHQKTAEKANIYNELYEDLKIIYSNINNLFPNISTCDGIANKLMLFNNNDFLKIRRLFICLCNFSKYSPAFGRSFDIDIRFSKFAKLIIDIKERLLKNDFDLNFLPDCSPQICVGCISLYLKFQYTLRQTITYESVLSGQCDQFFIQKHFPSPEILKDYSPFQENVSLLKEYIFKIKDLINDNKPLFDELNSSYLHFKSLFNEYKNLDKLDLIKNITIFITSLRNKITILQIPQNNKDLNIYLEGLRNYYNNLLEYNDKYQKMLDELIIIENILKSNMVISKLFNTTILNLESINSINDFISSLTKILNQSNLLLYWISVYSGSKYYDTIIIELQKMILKNKKHKLKYERLCKNVKQEIENHKAQIDKIKSKKSNGCEKCKYMRSYVLMSCGHTFCDDCYQSILSSDTHICSYCNLPFQSSDVMKIEWENNDKDV